MSQITTPTKEQILKAAECKTPKEALEMLFPDVFEKEFDLRAAKPCKHENGFNIDIGDTWLMCTSIFSEYQWKSIRLNDTRFDWKIVTSKQTKDLLLIPTPK